MRPIAAVVVVLTICLASGQPTTNAQTQRTPAAVSAEAIAQVRSRGIVRVILKFDGAFASEALLGSTRAAAQRNSIASAQARLLARVSRVNAAKVRRFTYVPYLALEVDEVTLQALAAAPDVAEIQIDGLLKATLAESTALIGATSAWDEGYTGAGWTVAVLDTGVDQSHPFLAGKVVSEACYSSTVSGYSTSVCPGGVEDSTSAGSGAPCAMADCAHGTHVAGIVAGKGNDFSGVARDASIIAVQVFSSVATDCGGEPAPCARAYESDLIAGLERVYSLRNTHRIAAVNMSLGSGVFTSPCDSNPSKAIIDQLRDSGIATVVSSGNDGSVSGISSPACISTAISVGSTTDGSFGTAADQISSFTNSNQYLTLLAPGETITSSVPGGGFAGYTGTSMSAAHVSGAWAVLKGRSPAASVAEVSQALTSTGVGVFDSGNGLTKPRIRIAAAVQAVQAPCSYAVTPKSVTLPRRGGTITVVLTTGDGCSWSTSTNAGFVSISGSTGHGSVSLTLSIDANPLLTRRAAVAMFAGTVVTIDQAGVASGDVDADGFGDLIWQHMTNGSVATWYLEAKNVMATSRLSIDRVADVNWRIVGSGDLNGDGPADVVWQHEMTGQLAVWYLSGTQVVATLPLSIDRVEDTNWKIRAVGDANGDGFADLFWQHTTQGWLAVWFMRGAEAIATESLSPARVPDTSWRVAGAGDIDGDRKADLLWQNDDDGRVAAWLMDGTRAVGQRVLSIPSVTDPNWKLSGVSDASGDGYADALWQNMVTGELAVWYLTGFEVIGTHRLSHGVGSGSQWHLVGPG